MPGIQIVEQLTSKSIRTTYNRMRTTLDLPEDLMEEAKTLLGFTSKTDTVIHALKELIRRHRVRELRSLLGTGEIDINIDIAKSRRRPPAK